MTWEKGIHTLTSLLPRVDIVKLLTWGPWGYSGAMVGDNRLYISVS